MSHRTRCAIAAALAVVVPALLLTAPSRAFAQADPLADFGDPVDRVNAPYRSVPDAQRAELVLLPAIGAMDDAPEGLDELRDAVLLAPAIAGWAEADAWASGAAQRAALDALRSVTESGARFRFALLYGAGNVDSEIRDTGYFPRLTNDSLLAGAAMRHLDALDRLLALVAVEAERLAAGGDTDAGADLLMRGVNLSRLIADRAFFAENRWAMQRMVDLLEAMRDLVYRYPDGATAEGLLRIVERANEENLRVERILLPEADRLAALQFVRDTYVRFGQPDLDRFAPTMAVVADVDRPLARFGEASWWRRVGREHAGYYDSIDAVNQSYNDWTLRWSLASGDPVLDSPTHFEQLDAARFAAVRAIVPNLDELAYLRYDLYVAQDGTRTAMAVMAYRLDRGVYPRPLFAIRPRYIQSLPIDPYDPRVVDPYQYFVPIRDQPRGDREAPRPHEMLVVTDDELNLAAYIAGANQFIDLVPDATLAANRDAIRDAVSGIVESGGAGDWATRLLNMMLPWAEATPDNFIEEKGPFDPTLFTGAAGNARLRSIAEEIGRRGEIDPRAAREALKIIWRIGLTAELAKDIAEARAEQSMRAFSVLVDDSVFVLYSVGFDEQPGFAATVGPSGGDILLWPPVISLQRDRLVELGLLGE